MFSARRAPDPYSSSAVADGPSGPRRRRALADVRRALRRRRRTLAVLLGALMAMVVIPSWAPASAHTTAVVVAAHDLRAGQTLTSGDLTVKEVADALVPEDSLSRADAALGARLSTPVGSGAVITRQWFAADSAAMPGPSQDAIAVPADPALVAHLTAGSRVRLVVSTPDPAGSRTLVATVLEVPETAGQTGASLPGGASEAPRVIVAVSPADVVPIAYATREGWVVMALLG